LSSLTYSLLCPFFYSLSLTKSQVSFQVAIKQVAIKQVT
jgi:hypothetical protein